MDATVTQLPEADSTSLALTVALDSVPLTLRVGCRQTGDASVPRTSRGLNDRLTPRLQYIQ